MSEEREIVQLSLEPGSLDDLLAGQWAYCFHLTPDPELPGTYRLAANVPSEDAGEAWLRAPLYELPESAPREPATDDVAGLVDDLRERMGWPEAPA